LPSRVEGVVVTIPDSISEVGPTVEIASGFWLRQSMAIFEIENVREEKYKIVMYSFSTY
jgi:hypothetical protein